MRSRTTLTLLAVLAAVATTMALAACGSDDGDDSSSSAADTSAPAKTTETAPTGGAELTLDAVEQGPGQYSFSKKSLTANSGKVTIAMANPAGNQAPHAIEVEGNGVEEAGQIVDAGGTSTVTADLPPGKYEFYCPVDGHRADGMEGTLTVK